MANLLINEQDAQRLREIARRENRPVEEIVSQMIEVYASQRNANVTQTQPSEDRSGYTAKLYAQARAYWRSVNDVERLSLTDEQLDEQFWCFDPEGIPRLKSDQDKVTVPADNLLTMLEKVWQDNPTGEVEEPLNYREILNKDFPEYLMRRMQGNNAQSNSD
jgi:hypothetical protein